jgi:GTPase
LYFEEEELLDFVDEVRIRVASGRGGPGCVSFRRETYVPRGGPDGGDGGKGGDLIFRVSRRLHSLSQFRHRRLYAAEDGVAGAAANCTGVSGKDLILEAPPGTIIRDLEGRMLADLGEVDEFKLLQGGRGGKGNTFFKTSVNQAPDRAQPGEEGQNMEIQLELKLIADVGIIGYPNVGKSTLISRISAARPKIADYPFTTLQPNLGVVDYGDTRSGDSQSFVVADIPGLIPEAHKGVGLGTKFLRHIERTKIFVHLIDVSEATGRDPLQDYRDINRELTEYDRLNEDKEDFVPLGQRQQIVVLNKIDVCDENRKRLLMAQFRKETGLKSLVISAVTGQGVKELIHHTGRILFGEVE